MIETNKLIASIKARTIVSTLIRKKINFTGITVYLEQKVAFLSGKYKKVHGKQKIKLKTLEKT